MSIGLSALFLTPGSRPYRRPCLRTSSRTTPPAGTSLTACGGLRSTVAGNPTGKPSTRTSQLSHCPPACAQAPRRSRTRNAGGSTRDIAHRHLGTALHRASQGHHRPWPLNGPPRTRRSWPCTPAQTQMGPHPCRWPRGSPGRPAAGSDYWYRSPSPPPAPRIMGSSAWPTLLLKPTPSRRHDALSPYPLPRRPNPPAPCTRPASEHTFQGTLALHIACTSVLVHSSAQFPNGMY